MTGRFRDLTLTPREHAVAKAIKREYGLTYPFAAHLARTAVATLDALTDGAGLRGPASTTDAGQASGTNQ